MIPKIIHQMWKTEELPTKYQNAAAAWRAYHPDWEYKFWTDESMLKYMEDNHPDYLDVYNGFRYPIQRSDFFRYFILYDYGGIYSDLDMFPTENLEKYLTPDVVNFVPSMNAVFYSEMTSIFNGLMIAPRGSGIMREIQKTITGRPPWFAKSKHLRVMCTTGAYIIQQALKNSGETFVFLSRELFNPFSMRENDNVVRRGISPVIQTVDNSSTWNSSDAKFLNYMANSSNQTQVAIIAGVFAVFILLVLIIVYLK